MITENERDRRTAAWLIETCGAEAVAEAETRIAGARKPYPSNIAKVLGVITLPEALKRTENASARQKLASEREDQRKEQERQARRMERGDGHGIGM